MHLFRRDNAVRCLNTGQCAPRQLKVVVHTQLHCPSSKMSKQVAIDMTNYIKTTAEQTICSWDDKFDLRWQITSKQQGANELTVRLTAWTELTVDNWQLSWLIAPELRYDSRADIPRPSWQGVWLVQYDLSNCYSCYCCSLLPDDLYSVLILSHVASWPIVGEERYVWKICDRTLMQAFFKCKLGNVTWRLSHQSV